MQVRRKVEKCKKSDLKCTLREYGIMTIPMKKMLKNGKEIISRSALSTPMLDGTVGFSGLRSTYLLTTAIAKVPGWREKRRNIVIEDIVTLLI